MAALDSSEVASDLETTSESESQVESISLSAEQQLESVAADISSIRGCLEASPDYTQQMDDLLTILRSIDEKLTPAETDGSTETEASLEEETETVPETSPVYQEDLKMIVDNQASLLAGQESLVAEVVSVRDFNQNMQNIQLPIMCGIGLCAGLLLVLVLSRYLKH
jgi:hypothetical protein